jgi:hypothetical protein
MRPKVRLKRNHESAAALNSTPEVYRMTPALDYPQFTEPSHSDYIAEEAAPTEVAPEESEMSESMRELLHSEADRWRAMQQDTRRKLNGSSSFFGRLFRRK